MAFLLKDYKDIQEIARGGMGKVYLSTQVSLNRKVIIKEMATGLLTSATEIKRFENEARAAALLDHDNIIRIYDFGEDRGSFYISMEYIDGPDVETLLRDAHCIPEIALMIVLHALKGLNFAHQHQIIHRDIKPGNILVSKVGAVKVVDFGLAHAGAQQMHLTATDTIVGTPLYMSPEQASGEERKNIQMDIWSVGVLLYRIITGDYPFKGDNVPAILYSIVQSQQPPMQELAPALPDDLAQNINLCLEKDRDNRLTNLAPLIESLQSYFYDIGIRDTAEQIRRYITDPAASTRELSRLLLEYHGSKGIELEAAGDAVRAQAHLREVKKFDPAYKPIARPPEPFKRHTSSAMLKKSPLITQKTGYHPQPPAPAKTGKRAVIVAVIVALVIAAGGGAYYLMSKKVIRPFGEQTTAPQKASVPQVPQKTPEQLAFLADSARKADSVRMADSLAIEAAKADSARKVVKPAAQKKTHGKVAEKSKPSAVTGPTGTLKVAINPPSAEVTIDGIKISAQEMSAGRRLQAGVHQLIARAAGYEPYSRNVSVEKGSTQIISADLSSLAAGMASLHIYSYPWAEIYLDGVFQGNTPIAKPLTVSEGTHTVVLKRAGYKTYQETVTCARGELRRIKVTLTAE